MVLFFGTLLVLSLSLPAQATTTIEPGIERTYDPNGRLSQAVYLDSPAKGTTETLTINEETGVWLRRFLRNGRLVREEREEFGKDERLLRRQTLSSSAENGKLDRRVVERFLALEVERRAYELISGQWVQHGLTADSSILLESGLSPVSQYARCLKNAGKAAGDARSQSECRKFLDDVLNLDLTKYDAFANLQCNDTANAQIFLPEGFRIDTATCGSDPWVLENIKAGVSALLTDMQCLAGVNPAVARRMAARIAERRPRINCLGGEVRLVAGSPLYERLCGRLAVGSNSEECAEKVSQLRDPRVGAFFNVATPNDIYLVAGDPRLDSHKYPAAANKLAGLMLHEFLHMAGIPHDERLVDCNGTREIVHNCFKDKDFQKDAIYGCSAVCGADRASASHWTKEGCHACVMWNNKDGDEHRCDKPPADF